MLPWSYGFHWTTASVIFLGAFYTVLIVILTTLASAASRSWRDMRSHRAEEIRWHADFEDLPGRDRACRHQITGEVKRRMCPNAFDCRICETHPKLLARRAAAGPAEQEIFGMPFPVDRLYHRGHTWARPEPDGTVAIGLDELARRVLGEPERVLLPPLGARLRANGTAWRIAKGGSDVRLLSPVDGEVIATRGPGDDWYLKVRPLEQPADLRHLLCAAEVKPWIMRELERLQIALGGTATSASLADGGVLVGDLGAACPAADWDAVYGEMFLQP
jgi:glycine cleavage system H protein